MQYKKEEVRNKILSAATDEFEAEGYEKSSIGKIAAKSGVPTGNIYRYFKNKAALFDGVAGRAYRELPELIRMEYERDQQYDRNARDTARLFAEGIEKIFETYKKQLIILADKSAGSQFEDFYPRLCDYLAELMEAGIYGGSTPSLMAKIISKGFLDGLFEILRNSKNITEGVEQLLLFYFYKIEEII